MLSKVQGTSICSRIGEIWVVTKELCITVPLMSIVHLASKMQGMTQHYEQFFMPQVVH